MSNEVSDEVRLQSGDVPNAYRFISRFYRPLVDMANTVLDFLAKDPLDESVKLGLNRTWAEPLQVESLDDALDDGPWIPRLKVNGERATTSRDNFL